MNDLTTRIVLAQCKALHTDLFEVGVFNAEKSRMMLRTWDTNSLIKSIPWLRWRNALGENIYVRPAGEHAMSMVDDLTADSLKQMKEAGYTPSCVIQTSPNNFQAWLHHGKVLPKDLSTLVTRQLAKEWGGDVKAADWRHFGRLASFTNRKAKHQQPDGRFPFCRLIEASGQSHKHTDRLIDSALRLIDEQKRRQHEFQQQVARAPERGPLKTIEHFRADPKYQGDGNRIDFAYAIYAHAHGVPMQEIAAQIKSRDLTKKGNERAQMKYIEGTIAKALTKVGLSR